MEWSCNEPFASYVDGTLGAEGMPWQSWTACREGTMDRARSRSSAVERTGGMLNALSDRYPGRTISCHHQSYRDLPELLEAEGIEKVDRILLDLGLSSDQLACRERGFSFRVGGPLDLRFDTQRGIAAADWLAKVPERELAIRFTVSAKSGSVGVSPEPLSNVAGATRFETPNNSMN